MSVTTIIAIAALAVSAWSLTYSVRVSRYLRQQHAENERRGQQQPRRKR